MPIAKDNAHLILDYPIEKWQSLFALIPEITEKVNSGWTWQEFEASDILLRYCRLCHETEIMISFAWMKWQEGKDIYQGTSDIAAIDEMDVVSLCKLLTMINRADRFNGGLIAHCLANGFIVRVLRVLAVRVNDGKINKS